MKIWNRPGKHRDTRLARVWRVWTNPYPSREKSMILDDIEWGEAIKAMAQRRITLAW